MEQARHIIERLDRQARDQNDIRIYSSLEYLKAVAAAEHFEPGTILRLSQILKGRGVTVGRWDRAICDLSIQERKRIDEEAEVAAVSALTQQVAAEPEPWPEPVDGALLAEEISQTLRRYIVVDQHARITITLYIFFTYLIDQFDVAPRLAVTSPTKRCAKTRLLEVLSFLVFRSFPTSSIISTAAIFHSIDAGQVTLLIDEFDALTARLGDERGLALRAVLNSGHRRRFAFVTRVNGRYNTFAPIVFALISQRPLFDTLQDRSIEVRLKRKLRAEPVERLFGKDKQNRVAALEVLARKLRRWTDDNRDRVAQTEPSIPDDIENDRAVENWTPLLAIAACLDSGWSRLTSAAAVELSNAVETQDTGELVLHDLRDVFDVAKSWRLAGREVKRLSSAHLCTCLSKLEGRPWSEFRRGRSITPTQLARLLRPFGVIPGTIALRDGKTLKGYDVEQFTDAFERHLQKRQNVKNAGGVEENRSVAEIQAKPDTAINLTGTGSLTL